VESLFSVDANELRWVRNGLHYELRTDDAVVATLACNITTRTGGYAETADGAWSLKREGVIQPSVTVYSAGTEDKVALFLARQGPQRRLLVLDAGYFTWIPAYERGRHVWKFLDQQDQCLFFLTLRQDEPLAGVVELMPFARYVTLLPLLLALSWFELVMECEETARPKAKMNV
jgi:hypothetical protein